MLIKSVKLLFLLLVLTTPLFADGVFSFSSAPGDVGKTDTFIAPGSRPADLTVIVSGYLGSGVLTDMFFNNRGPNEIGLGLANGFQNEISGNEFIQLNTNPFNTVPVHTITIGVDSIQDNESYDIWGSDTAGVLGKLVFANQTSPNLTFEPAYQFYSVTAVGGNVLLDGFSVSTPEPSSLLLLLAGLALIILVRIRNV